MAITIIKEYNHLPDIANDLETQVERALDDGVVTLIDVADQNTPVDTGALRANKTIEASQGERTVTWNQGYSLYVHEGTYKMAARPFARIAADAAVEAIETSLAQWPR